MLIPLVPLALAYITGILLGQAFLYVPCSVAAVTACTVTASLFRSRTVGWPLRQVASASFAALAGASLLITSATYLPADHYSRALGQPATVQEVSGRISSPLERSDDRVVFLLAVSAVNGKAASGDLRVTVREALPAFGRGDSVRMTGRISPPRSYRNPGGFDYRAFLARQGVHAVMTVKRGMDLQIESRGTGPLRLVEDLRERMRQAFLGSTRGDGSAVLRAMVLGDTSGLTEDLRQRFMTAGVTHILSISGSHLGLVAVLSFWLFRNILFLLPERTYHRITLSLDPRKAAAIATAVPVAFYALLAGAEVATMRSLIMILIGLSALVLDREHRLLPALALAALITLLPDPQALFDISFQLSYLSVAAILFVVSTGNLIDRGTDRWYIRLAQSGAMLLAVSVATAVVTGPLVALYFHQISFIGVVANMVVVPFAGAVVVPLGLLSGILSPFLGTLPLAGPVQWAADFFVSQVTFFAGLPGAMAHLRAPGMLFVAAYTAMIAAAAVSLRAWLLRKYRPLDAPGRVPEIARWTLALSTLLLLAVLLVPLFRLPRTRVTFLDVGQGDCALVETAGGCRILIDGGGTRENRFDPGLRVAAPYLWERGVGTIDLAVLSHPHPDHMNGLTSLIRTFPVREVWASGLDTDLEGYGSFSDAVVKKCVPFRSVRAGQAAQIKDAVIEVLHPPQDFPQRVRKAYAAENDRSLVLRIRSSTVTYLFAGDIHGEAEGALLSGGSTLGADVIKVPHHGSKTSSTPAFISAVHPSVAVIFVGEGNLYHHPSEETVRRYREAGVAVYRTDQDGAVIARETAEGIDMCTGADLLLERIDGWRPGRWGTTERKNWKRLWIREWEI